jgi:hypothetical protein
MQFGLLLANKPITWPPCERCGHEIANNVGTFSETGEAVTGVVREQVSSKSGHSKRGIDALVRCRRSLCSDCRYGLDSPLLHGVGTAAYSTGRD